MISMTGFGTSTSKFRLGSMQIDIKAVNSKGMEISLRIPQWLKDKELELRKHLSDRLIRGKVEFSISEIAVHKEPAIDWNVLKSYISQLKIFQQENDIKDANILSALLQMQDVQNSVSETANDEEYNSIIHSLEEALRQLIQFRLTEGKAMEDYIKERISAIEVIYSRIIEAEPVRTEKVKKKLLSGLQHLMPELIDKNRLEQEMIFYVEKLDIQEELSRLKSHVEYFKAIVVDDKPEKGKRLGFISQEFLREANTIGSKANDAEIQQLVVMLKDEIEKIKEQLNNVL